MTSGRREDRRRHVSVGTLAVVAGAMCAAVACLRSEPPLAASYVDADATFVAHTMHGGIAIDRAAGPPMTRIVARGFRGLDPTYVVRNAEGGALAGLWVIGPAAVVARASLSNAAPVAVEVTPDWTEQAIRLSVDGQAGRLHTGPFARVDGRAGLPVLSRVGQTNLDIRGIYRATIFDGGGAQLGWFEVRAPSPDEPRVFQGRLPPASLAAGPALAVALTSELDWIDDHTIDVYRGTGRDRGTIPSAR
jgi:hypothetical protein